MAEPPKEKRLSPTKIKILHFLHTNRNFRGSKVQLRKMMGYPSDGSINPHLNKLIDDGYVKEEQTPDEAPDPYPPHLGASSSNTTS